MWIKHLDLIRSEEGSTILRSVFLSAFVMTGMSYAVESFTPSMKAIARLKTRYLTEETRRESYAMLRHPEACLRVFGQGFLKLRGHRTEYDRDASLAGRIGAKASLHPKVAPKKREKHRPPEELVLGEPLFPGGRAYLAKLRWPTDRGNGTEIPVYFVFDDSGDVKHCESTRITRQLGLTLEDRICKLASKDGETRIFDPETRTCVASVGGSRYTH